VALLEKRRFLYNHSGDFPQVILIIPSHVPNTFNEHIRCLYCSYTSIQLARLVSVECRGGGGRVVSCEILPSPEEVSLTSPNLLNPICPYTYFFVVFYPPPSPPAAPPRFFPAA
jgi:hypothetical protein